MAAEPPKCGIFEKIKKSRKGPSMLTIYHNKHGCTCFQKNFSWAHRHTTTIFKIPQKLVKIWVFWHEGSICRFPPNRYWYQRNRSKVYHKLIIWDSYVLSNGQNWEIHSVIQILGIIFGKNVGILPQEVPLSGFILTVIQLISKKCHQGFPRCIFGLFSVIKWTLRYWKGTKAK